MEVIANQDDKPAERIDEAGDTLKPQRKWTTDGYENCRDTKENADPLEHLSRLLKVGANTFSDKEASK